MNKDEAMQLIRTQLSQGIKEDQISGELMQQGMNYRDITQLIVEAKQNPTAPQPQPQPQPASNQGQAQFTAQPNISPSMAPMGNFTSEPKRKKTVLFVAIAIVALFVLAGGAYAYYYFSNPSPETVLHKMMANISQVNSFSAALSGDFTSESSGMNSFFGETASSSATTTINKAHTELSMDIDLTDINNPQFSVNFNGNSGSGLMTVVLGGQVIYKDKTGYVKVSPGTSFGPISLNMIAGQWIKIDPQKDISTSTIPGVGLGVSGDELNITPDQITRVRDIIKNAYFFDNVVKLPDETINGVSTRHYKYSINESALNKFTDDIALVFDPKYVATTTPIVPQGASMEIWVGAGDYLPRKISESDDKNQVQVTYSNYNSVPAIQVPQNTKSFQDVLGEVFGSMFGSTIVTSKATTTANVTNSPQFSTARQAFNFVASSVKAHNMTLFIEAISSNSLSLFIPDSWMKVTDMTFVSEASNGTMEIIQSVITQKGASPFTTKLGFTKENGSWKLNLFASGRLPQ